MNVNYIFAAIVVASAIIVGVPIWWESYDPAPHGIIGVVVILMWWFMPPMQWLLENWIEAYAAALLVVTFASIRHVDEWCSPRLGVALAGACVYVLVYPSASRLVAITGALLNVWWAEGIRSWPVVCHGPFKRIRAWWRGKKPAQTAPGTATSPTN